MSNKELPAGECPDCWGKGYASVYAGQSVAGDFIGDRITAPTKEIAKKPCRRCHGTGRLKAPKVGDNPNLAIAIIKYMSEQNNETIMAIGGTRDQQVRSVDKFAGALLDIIDGFASAYAVSQINDFCARLNRRLKAEGRAMPIGIADACETLEEMFPGSTTE